MYIPRIEEVEELLRTEPLPPLYLSKTVEMIEEVINSAVLFKIQHDNLDKDSIGDHAYKKSIGEEDGFC